MPLKILSRYCCILKYQKNGSLKYKRGAHNLAPLPLGSSKLFTSHSDFWEISFKSYHTAVSFGINLYSRRIYLLADKNSKPDMVTHTCNLSISHAEAGELLWVQQTLSNKVTSRPAEATGWQREEQHSLGSRKANCRSPSLFFSSKSRAPCHSQLWNRLPSDDPSRLPYPADHIDLLQTSSPLTQLSQYPL